ncbi:hypothetical protein BCV69DRAFT_161915 [Microstroma glucosiphilum]|uniref:Cytoplasmic tRNA 2-thiolation protein 1 n=1 Tax=Pseudomicrostroma glucosiphilum TaxID=1684307 RepID=A0A316UA05_9BASI|nr:hypothetical protein BCV69DRAFT_161915 [Pseudomicrostroma glucosiphilum]PWN22002.1 hypothetical protein BCV69DRAFT_161915 [Pseudomicrostroma glucosiphilum]
MAPRLCSHCNVSKAVLRRPKTGLLVCRPCFFYVFETEIHQTILDANLFKPGEKVAIGASGGKDSTVLAYVMKTLNERYNYGLDLFLLSIDEGITGYRDDSLETVKQNSEEYGLPLKVLGYNELYGWTMDDIVKSIGRKNNCTFCGVFRRQALDRGAAVLGVDHIVTGHNADDIAETVLMNVLRGDISRLSRCTEIVTQSADADPSQGCGGTVNEDGSSSLDFLGIKRSKPFKYAYEKEIVLYAYFKSLTYFSTECIYSPNAYRGYARAYLKDLESIRPSAIIDIIHSGEALKVGWREEENSQENGEGKQSNSTASKGQARQVQQTCKRCGYITSNELCKACVLLEGLNKGVPNLGIKSSVKVGGVSENDAAGTAANRVQPRPTTAMLRAAASAF